ncbi:hypothetical protein A2U01_0077434, partial [Trifolium medium]|nr:hypothetical protein [Trifolium medium]
LARIEIEGSARFDPKEISNYVDQF